VVQFRMGSSDIHLTNPSSYTMVLGSTQRLNRNEYQETSWGKGHPTGRHIWPTASSPSVSRFCKKCVSFYVSQSCVPAQPVTGIAHFIFIFSYDFTGILCLRVADCCSEINLSCSVVNSTVVIVGLCCQLENIRWWIFSTKERCMSNLFRIHFLDTAIA
jgi:hypothetical protein